MLRASLGLTTIGAILLCVGSAHAQGFVAVPDHHDHWQPAHVVRVDHEHWDHDHFRHEHPIDYRVERPHVVEYVQPNYVVAPQPTYVAPQATYYAPQPTCVTPQPAVVVPQATYYAPQPHVGLSVVGRNFGFSIGH